MSEFNPTKYKNAYQKKNYDRLVINVPKGQGERIKEHAEKMGKSINGYVVGLIKKDMGME